MGLDITAYSKLIRTDNENDEDLYFSRSSFKQSNMPLIDGVETFFDFDKCETFHAGSHGGYNRFREILCESINKINPSQVWDLAVFDTYEAKKIPFFYLINFSDCEGYIGTSFCEILYNDFCEYEELFMSKLEDDYYKTVYLNFKKAFEIGRDHGLVDFH